MIESYPFSSDSLKDELSPGFYDTYNDPIQVEVVVITKLDEFRSMLRVQIDQANELNKL